MNDSADEFEPRLEGLPAPVDASGLNSRDSLEILLSGFADEVRRGSSPSIESYVERHPQWESEIRELFPLIFSLERWKSDKEMECLRRSVPEDFTVEALGEYRVTKELGRGGMGVVFHAVHTRSARPVAIKLLPWRYAVDMERWKERFHREASTIAGLRHDNIVQVYSFGRHEGYYYYVMQYVEGIGLDRIIEQLRRSSRPCHVDELVTEKLTGKPPRDSGRRGSFETQGKLVLERNSWRGFAKLGAQIASALRHAHQQGILHNDVKPANLLVKANGQIILTDFGLGRLNSEGGAVDRDEATVGTLRYTAPERLQGVVDARCDVYSLGVTLYELMTQVTPFAAINRADLLHRVLHEDLKRPSIAVPQIPPPLETILLKATARQPKDRYDSAQALTDDLQRFMEGRRIRATRKNFIQKAMDWIAARRARVQND